MAVIRGIDVSSHQDRVDWTRVKGDGIAFAFIKATEGVGYVDPKCQAHAAGAKSVGLPYGFYHFARPDTHSGTTPATVRKDATAEADSFLANAAPTSGNLLPVLDLETAGLRPSLLVEWTKAWLEHMTQRIGVRPILYTYPAFWSNLGNTKAFARYPLWIASYGVSTPQLPAGWGRYAIWQYTSTGTVHGIPGHVDLNRLGDRVKLADVTYKPKPAPPAPKQHFPGPVPKPGWFWPWLRWRLGAGEFEGLAQLPDLRPDEAPAQIPDWAFACEKKLLAARKKQLGS